ncbi:DUF309 domain-containing protein [Paenibacillus albicereus]|uniref:DUF309 domain-containing protein n=1 Tax=Paenibacillus albicereus TaxID=2726185 RepID=A0A6H2GX24_9BACL|nr:DUF309 domain-containing protein [Paenibacillus albicereus]QJC51981.1 DUF309 domain-containing protein [Paenibacillus albicereus]
MQTTSFHPDAYIRYLAQFHGTRDYFECHELLEDYWKEHPGADSGLWHGLIQIAVGQYHLRRGNRGGARKMLRSAWERLRREDLGRAGLDGPALLALLDDAAGRLEAGEPLPYRSWTLPIEDPDLLAAAREESARLGAAWCVEGEPAEEIVHRHRLRDRSGVVLARRESLERKRPGEAERIDARRTAKTERTDR